MSPRPSLAFAIAAALFTLAPAAARADKLPQTTALQTELTVHQDSLTNVAKRLAQANAQVEDARKKVVETSNLIKAIDHADDSLARIIKELKTLSNIPQLNALPPIVKLLEGVRKQLHAVRVQADKFNAEVLKPLDAGLKDLDAGIDLAIQDTNTSAANAKLARAGVTETRRFIVKRGSVAAEVAGLERSAKAMRAVGRPTAVSIAALDQASGEIEKLSKLVADSLQALIVLKPGIDEFVKDMKPFNDVAAELKKVMSQKISVKLFDKTYAFTVRQVLEGPKNLAGIILKPLQDLADKVIADVIKAFKLKLQAPPEVAALAKKLTAAVAVIANFTQSIDPLQNSFDTQFLKTYDQALTKLPKR